MKKHLTKLITAVTYCLISAAFIYWGWTILAPHLNAPLFTFWEVFGIRMGLGSFVKLFYNKSE